MVTPMLDMSYNTICTNCGQVGTSCYETLHFPRFTNRNDDSPAYCYYCPICGLQVRINQSIDGQVLEQIQQAPSHFADRIRGIVEEFYDLVAGLLYTYYDPTRKYSVISIPQLDLTCPRHKTRMLQSANWLAQPPLDCRHCGGTRFVVPYDEPPDM